MRHGARRGVMIVGCVMIGACGSDIALLDGPLPAIARARVDVHVSSRALFTGEALPHVTLDGRGGDLVFAVARDWLCAPMVTTEVRRTFGLVRITTEVRANPLADCFAFSGATVYSGSIELPLGAYRVEVYESTANGATELLSATNVTVSRPTFVVD